MEALSRLILSVSLFASAPAAALAQEQARINLFKVINGADEIVIGLNDAELKILGGSSAGAVARGLSGSGELTVWQYAVKKAANGDLQYAPLRQIGLLATHAKRVEPYSTPLAVVPHE